jgi:SnoaL-like domain
VTDLEKRMDELISRQEIYDLSCKYLRAQDRLMPELHRSVFWDDATTDYGAYVGGPDGFVKFAQDALRPHGSNHHMMGQAFIEIEGEVAFGEIYFQAFHRITRDGEELDLFISGRYVDRYERRGGVWKIAHRSEKVDWARTEPAADEWIKTSPDAPLGARGDADLSNQRERLRKL